MRYSLLLIALIFNLFFTVESNAQELHVYKTIDTTKLYLEVIRPETKSKKPLPAVVFFFGGGWFEGDRQHFSYHAEYLAKRGMVAILADYRIKSIHGTNPFISLEDAKSAMRYVRSQADKLGIDPNKIAAGGGSAGGHLAAATALVTLFNAPEDDLTVSPIPNALLLYNPVIDNGPGGYGYERIGETYPEFSPLHNIRAGAPPTILFLGTKDKLIPVVTCEYYKMVMESVGSRCDLHLYEGKTHGFFNYRHPEMFKDTMMKTDEFLQSLGFLDKKPRVKIE